MPVSLFSFGVRQRRQLLLLRVSLLRGTQRLLSKSRISSQSQQVRTSGQRGPFQKGPLLTSQQEHFKRGPHLTDLRAPLSTPQRERASARAWLACCVRFSCSVSLLRGTQRLSQSLEWKIQSLGCRVQGSRFMVHGSGFKVEGSGFRVHNLGFMVPGSWFRVQSSGIWLPGSECACR